MLLSRYWSLEYKICAILRPPVWLWPSSLLSKLLQMEPTLHNHRPLCITGQLFCSAIFFFNQWPRATQPGHPSVTTSADNVHQQVLNSLTCRSTNILAQSFQKHRLSAELGLWPTWLIIIISINPHSLEVAKAKCTQRSVHTQKHPTHTQLLSYILI